MTILKAVGESADLSELPERERVEIEGLAAAVTLSALQRHLAILLKAESDMGHSTFVRLILEMALLKMATLSPVVPVNDLLERLKALEGRTGGALIASAPPAWEPSLPQGASGGPAVGSGSKTMARRAEEPRPAAPPPRQEPATAERSVVPQVADVAQNEDSWVAFVSFVKGKKPMLASFLEHGHPLKISESQLEIGFLNGSFQLSRLRDPDAAAELQMLAREFYQVETMVRLVSLTGEIVVPPSILEKKSLEDADRKQRMTEVATSHPMIAAALEIFGGEVGEVKETDKSE